MENGSRDDLGTSKRRFQLSKRTVLPMLALLAVASVATVYAATVTVAPHMFEAILGGAIINHSSINAVDEGFEVYPVDIAAAGTSASSPVTFGLATATNGVTTGHWVLFIALFATATTPAATNFVVTLQMFNGAARQTFTLYIATGASVVSGTEVDCAFDLGTSLNPTITYTLTVQ
jgi:hypothetical protein